MGVWLGLIVIWVCLTLVFTAHRLSESYIRLEAPDKPHLNRDQTLLRALEPNVKLTQARKKSLTAELNRHARFIGLDQVTYDPGHLKT